MPPIPGRDTMPPSEPGHVEPAIATRAVAIAPTARLPIVKGCTLFHQCTTLVPQYRYSERPHVGNVAEPVNIKRDGYNAEYQRYDHGYDGSDSHT